MSHLFRGRPVFFKDVKHILPHITSWRLKHVSNQLRSKTKIKTSNSPTLESKIFLHNLFDAPKFKKKKSVRPNNLPVAVHEGRPPPPGVDLHRPAVGSRPAPRSWAPATFPPWRVPCLLPSMARKMPQVVATNSSYKAHPFGRHRRLKGIPGCDSKALEQRTNYIATLAKW